MNAPFVFVCRLAVMKGSDDFWKTLPILPRSQISLSLSWCKFSRKSRGPLHFATSLSCFALAFARDQSARLFREGTVISVNFCFDQLEFGIFGFRHLWQTKIFYHFLDLLDISEMFWRMRRQYWNRIKEDLNFRKKIYIFALAFSLNLMIKSLSIG